ncbi:Gluconate 5-dehydrogenase [Lachnellula suecica]|uniref:Gluconate 5-dehydrogenase n=1 Tax=Lachnellula suecica TaxID=602035 RepID=A0A8T9C159_9HELO|nr:Gluconate 5-dehydrogenase [Lachnellula suecica]
MMKKEPLPFEEGSIAQRGAIVNAASVNSLLSLPGSVPYTTSKHAVMGITKTAALEARAHQIRVNALSQGFLLTELTRPLTENATGGVLDGLWGAMEKRQGRSAKVEEVGDVAVLITSPRMGLVNGVNLFVDG